MSEIAPTSVESVGATASITAPARPVPPLDADSEARLREAIATLRGRDPQAYEALKEILTQHNAEMPAPMAQLVRDQALAQLLTSTTSPPLPIAAPSAAASAAPDIALVSHTSMVSPAPTVPAATATGHPPSPALPALSPPATNNPAMAAPAIVRSSAEQSSGVAETGGTGTAVAETPIPPTAAATVALAQPGPAADEDLKAGQWQERVQQAIETLEKELARFKLDAEETARLHATLRLLYVVGNRREQAVSPIEGLSEDEREFWKQQYYGLLVSLDPSGMHAAASRRAALALRYYDTAQSHLSNLSTLDVRGLAFCSRVESFGRYDEFRTYDFRAGQEVLLYVEVDHFAAEKKGDQFETELQGEYEILDAQGVRIANVVLPRDRQLCNNRRRDYFIAYKFFLPKEISPGSYTLRLTMEDIKGKKSNQSSIDFKIR